MNSPSPSVIRSGLKAGTTFLGILALGAVLSILLGGIVAWLYWGTVITQGYPGVRAGGYGAILVLLLTPALLIGVLLPFFILAYGAISFFYAWRLALRQAVAAYSTMIADRLATTVTKRLADMPRTQETLRRVGHGLSEESVAQTLKSVLGGSAWSGRAAQRVSPPGTCRGPTCWLTGQANYRRSRKDKTWMPCCRAASMPPCARPPRLHGRRSSWS